jgi:hypothetical protein
MSSRDRIGSSIRKDKIKKSVEKAKESQPSKKPEKGAIAKGIFGAVKKAYQDGMERHRTAMGLAKETGKTVGKVAKGIGHVAGQFGSGAKTVAKASKKAVVGEEVDQIDEKITAKTDMGAAIRDFQSSSSKQLAGRSDESRRQAAIAAVLTARRGGKKVNEAVGAIPGKSSNQQPQTATSQRDTQQKQQKINAQRKSLMAQAAELSAKKSQLSKGVPLQTEENVADRAMAAVKANTEKKYGPASIIGTPTQQAALAAQAAKPQPKRVNKKPTHSGWDDPQYKLD